MNANEQFEEEAAQFLRETGILAPGKDDIIGNHSREDRMLAWLEWLERRESKRRDQELEDLKSWKESALEIFNELNLQEIGKVMGVPLGESIADKILPFIKNLPK